MRESFSSLELGLVLAIILVYLLMVANFQSWLEPFIIMMAVPGALAGVLWMLVLTGTTINVESMMGAIMAVGVGVANGNLLITFANEIARGGLYSGRRRDRGWEHPLSPDHHDRARDDPGDAADGARARRRLRAERAAGTRRDRRTARGDSDDAVRGAGGLFDIRRKYQRQTSARRGDRRNHAAGRIECENSMAEEDHKSFTPPTTGKIFVAGWIVAVVLMVGSTAGLVLARELWIGQAKLRIGAPI